MNRLSVIMQDESGLNTKFRDNYTGELLSRTETVRRVKNGVYDGYHVRTQKGTNIKYVASNPDKNKTNNLNK